MRITRVLLVCALALAPSLAAAQPAAPVRPAGASEVSAAELELAARLMQLMDMQGSAAAAIRVMLNAQIELDPELAPYRGVLEQWASDIFATPEALQAYARLYAERFTERELRELVGFHESPTGRRLMAEQAELIAAGERIGRELAEARQDELMELLQEAMEQAPRSRKND